MAKVDRYPFASTSSRASLRFKKDWISPWILENYRYITGLLTYRSEALSFKCILGILTTYSSPSKPTFLFGFVNHRFVFKESRFVHLFHIFKAENVTFSEKKLRTFWFWLHIEGIYMDRGSICEGLFRQSFQVQLEVFHYPRCIRPCSFT